MMQTFMPYAITINNVESLVAKSTDIGAWKQLHEHLWQYRTRDKDLASGELGVLADLHYQTVGDIFYPKIGWVLKARFYRIDKGELSVHTGTYPSAADALADFEVKVADNNKDAIEIKNRAQSREDEWQARNARLASEFNQALRGISSSKPMVPSVDTRTIGTPDVRQPAHLGRGFKNLLED